MTLSGLLVASRRFPSMYSVCSVDRPRNTPNTRKMNVLTARSSNRLRQSRGAGDFPVSNFPVLYPRVSTSSAVTFEGIEWQKNVGQKHLRDQDVRIDHFLPQMFLPFLNLVAADGRARASAAKCPRRRAGPFRFLSARIRCALQFGARRGGGGVERLPGSKTGV